jgi:hypothetical protein
LMGFFFFSLRGPFDRFVYNGILNEIQQKMATLYQK